MKFNSKLKKKISDLFRNKCIEIQSNCKEINFSSKWREYLMKIGCRVVVNKSVDKHWIVVQDPLYYGNFIRIPREFAEKVIVLNYLP